MDLKPKSCTGIPALFYWFGAFVQYKSPFESLHLRTSQTSWGKTPRTGYNILKWVHRSCRVLNGVNLLRRLGQITLSRVAWVKRKTHAGEKPRVCFILTNEFLSLFNFNDPPGSYHLMNYVTWKRKRKKRRKLTCKGFFKLIQPDSGWMSKYWSSSDPSSAGWRV